jgi:predicted MFS family arabinose efflux permease
MGKVQGKGVPMRENRYLLLGLLTLVGVLNFVDRYIVSILLESIKVDLDLADQQLGLLSGFYFAVFYGVFGIPIAILADRWHRGKIISLSLLMWSAMTFLSGYATAFSHLILARIGVGIGEAGVAPASHSLITERFEAAQRPVALAVYAVGGTVGILLALGVGGWINETYGWRTAFLAAGAPGIVLAGVAWFLIHERRPAVQLSQAIALRRPGEASVASSLLLLSRLPAWRHAVIAAALTHIATFGIGQFAPSLLSRSFGLGSSEIGFILALVIGLGGTVGAMSGGLIAGRLSAKRGIGWLAFTLAITFALAGILAPAALVQTDITLFLLFISPYYVLSLTSSGVQFAIAHAMVGPGMRATSSALLILIINLVGLGIGPLLVGQISDWLKPSFGVESLRYAMLAITPFLIWGAAHFYFAGRHLPRNVFAETLSGPNPAHA